MCLSSTKQPDMAVEILVRSFVYHSVVKTVDWECPNLLSVWVAIFKINMLLYGDTLPLYHGNVIWRLGCNITSFMKVISLTDIWMWFWFSDLKGNNSSVTLHWSRIWQILITRHTLCWIDRADHSVRFSTR